MLLRILAVNVLALAILVGGSLYLGRYQQSLITAELDALTVQARIFAGALAEGALFFGQGNRDQLSPELARDMMRRLVEITKARTRLFDPGGRLIADSRDLAGSAEMIQVEPLPPPEAPSPVAGLLEWAYDRVIDWLPGRSGLAVYTERAAQRAEHYPDVRVAMTGEASASVRSTGARAIVLEAAVPVQRLRHVLGTVYMSRPGDDIDQALRSVRLDIIRVFGVALAVTVFLSLYLFGTIARPVRLLAEAAERVRRAQGRQHVIPDFSHRHDEIGDLSVALGEMTASLWSRMMAIERFAADVAHEIKNPLSSLASAVETVTKVSDTERRDRLIAVIQDDVRRLDRLITDISGYSRLDAELSRIEPEPVDLADLLRALLDLHQTAHPLDDPGQPTITLDADESRSLVVHGVGDRLFQVFQNLLANAVSFAPAGSTVRLGVVHEGNEIVATVSDDGPGIPPDKCEAIFDRFYSERPASEKFGTHSGLGLSISRQIVEAAGGTITATNRTDGSGRVVGATFTVRLPAP